MRRRMTLMLLGMAVFVTGIGFVKFRQIQAAVAQAASFQPPPEAVTTILAHSEAWPETLSAIGTVAAVQGVVVGADLPGVVDKVDFESGRAVQAGDVLVELDMREEAAQLASAEAQRDLAGLNLDRTRGLADEGIISRSDFDRAAAEHKEAEARVGELRATIARKRIRAPFSGILGIRQVNRGQYLKAGDPIVPLQALRPIYVNFGVPQQEVGHLSAGHQVRVSTESLAGVEYPGRVTAIDSVIDQGTRNVQVQASLPNDEGRLHPGMFVRVRVALGPGVEVVSLPASAISYAPYGDSVFVVGDLKGPKGEAYRGVRQEFVKLGATRGDRVAVLSGVKAGDEVVTSGTFKLRNGGPVHVDNTVQPANEAAPRPEDN
jgi:membrane fusion protein, multidrug efflux system